MSSSRGAQKKQARHRAVKDRRVQEESERKRLRLLLAAEAPGKGTNPLAQDLKVKHNQDGTPTDTSSAKKEKVKVKRNFVDLPLSARTLKGLASAKFKRMTAIQRATLPHSLVGRDVLGAAKTGSGKTLAFLIPLLEKLWFEKWTKMDGLGGLIISPTRELAVQIFEALRDIGSEHYALSAGLLIGGGKNFREEQQRIPYMNILVCTPGRLLQHLDQTPGFTPDQLQVLVLDEADRMLDMGFSKEMNAILDHLPTTRQTLLFSATQSSSLSQLSRLALNEPEFISVHADSKFTTPAKLSQYYITCGVGAKVDFLWSFLRSHLTSKTIVFVNSQKQVRFLNEAFRLLRPGLSVLHLHGKMSQAKRMKIYWKFHDAKDMGVVLFATDIAARGLDFKNVHWVVQLDCPDSVDTYIHRAGRTARIGNRGAQKGGSALLVLLESENAMVEKLEARRIPLEEIGMNEKKQFSVSVRLQEILVKNEEIRLLALKALRSYVRSIFLMNDKEIFKVEELDLQALANSMGMLAVPQLNFITRKHIPKNDRIAAEKATRYDHMMAEAEKKQSASGHVIIPIRKKKEGRTKVEKLLKRKPQKGLSESAMKMINTEGEDDSDSDEEEFLAKKVTGQTHLGNLDTLFPAHERKKEKQKRGWDTTDAVLSDLNLPDNLKVGYQDEAREELEVADVSDKLGEKVRLRAMRQKNKERMREAEYAANPKRVSNNNPNGGAMILPVIGGPEDDSSDGESNSASLEPENADSASENGGDSENESESEEPPVPTKKPKRKRAESQGEVSGESKSKRRRQR